METINGRYGNHTIAVGRRNNGAGMVSGANGAAAVTLLRDVPLPLDVLGDLIVGRLWGARGAHARHGRKRGDDHSDSDDNYGNDEPESRFAGCGDAASGRGVTRFRLPPGALAVLRELLRHLGQHSNRVWPSQARLAERTGLSHASVERGVALLKRNGWIRCCDTNRESETQPGPRPRSRRDARPAYCAVNCYDLSALLALVPAFLRFRPAKMRDATPSPASRLDPRRVLQTECGDDAAAWVTFSAIRGGPGAFASSTPHFCGTEAERTLGVPSSGKVVVIDNNINNNRTETEGRVALEGDASRTGNSGDNPPAPNRKDDKNGKDDTAITQNDNEETTDDAFPDPFDPLDPFGDEAPPSQTENAPPPCASPATDTDTGDAEPNAPTPPAPESPLVAALLALRVAPKIARRLLAEKGEDAVARCLRVAARQRAPVGPGWIVAALSENWEGTAATRLRRVRRRRNGTRPVAPLARARPTRRRPRTRSMRLRPPTTLVSKSKPAPRLSPRRRSGGDRAARRSPAPPCRAGCGRCCEAKAGSRGEESSIGLFCSFWPSPPAPLPLMSTSLTVEGCLLRKDVCFPSRATRCMAGCVTHIKT